MKLKDFLFSDKNIKRDSYIWNMAGSMLMAFQSVVLLMILMRTVGITDAGIFTIAYANANLFLTIGKFGMRNFQVSDVKEQFAFRDYSRSRLVSTAAMIIVSCVYVVIVSFKNDYSANKSMIIVWMCLYKAIDALEDVYYGEYQQKGRLDIGSKVMTVRLAISMLLFAITVVVTNNLLLSLIITTVVTAAITFLLIRLTLKEFEKNYSRTKKGGGFFRLMWLCFPLFLGSFLSFYIGNAPKYSIDALLTDDLQACYGFIAMPVFVVGLLNYFIFNPVIRRLSLLWSENEIKKFVKRTFKQVIVVFFITLVCIGAAYLCGIPILSWLYNTDLTEYKKELLIMLLGGGFLGLSGLLNTVITIMRRQGLLLIGYMITALIALIFSNKVVGKYGIMGATVFYTVIMLVLCIIFAVIFVYGIAKKIRETK